MKRLERVLDGRRARLSATLAEVRRRDPYAGPMGGLQRYGYPLAILLAATAVLPTVIAFGWRRRKLLVGVAGHALAVRRLRKRFDDVRSTGSQW